MATGIDAESYEELELQLNPHWITGPMGERWFTAFGVVKDALHGSFVTAVKARFPKYAPPDALLSISWETGIDRVPKETTASLRKRLESPFDFHSWTGTDKGIIDQLSLLGIEATIVRNKQWDFDALAGDIPYYWARFWVIAYRADFTINDSTWDDGSTWDAPGDSLWDVGPEITGEDIDYMKKVILKTKHGPTKCEAIVAVVSGDVWDDPSTMGAWDDGTLWEESESVYIGLE